MRIPLGQAGSAYSFEVLQRYLSDPEKLVRGLEEPVEVAARVICRVNTLP